MSLQNALTVLFYSCSIFLIAAIFILFAVVKQQSITLRLDQIEIANNVESEKIILDSLDTIIENELTSYASLHIQFNPSFKLEENTEYEVTSEVANSVLDNMSNVMYDQLLMIYNKKKLPSLISDRVYIRVVAYLSSLE